MPVDTAGRASVPLTQLGQQFKMTVVAKDKLLAAEVSACCLVAVM